MGFDRRFTLGLIAWIAAVAVALGAVALAFVTPGLGAARIVAMLLVAGAIWGLWWHVSRTNVAVARFIEALRFDDTSARFGGATGGGFEELGGALDGAMDRLRVRQAATAAEMRFLEALVDDMPVALLTVDGAGAVAPANKAARRLFRDARGTRAEDYAVYGATLAKRLAGGDAAEEILLLAIEGRTQRVLVRSGTLERLGRSIRAVTVQPIQGTLDAVEMAAQTDLVRVLTHEILNSLTPVTSLAATAADLLDDPELTANPRIGDARAAVTTLARRAHGLGHFIEAYRAVAHTPDIQRQAFAAGPWAEELGRIFAARQPDLPLAIDVRPARLSIDADPDLLAQVLINLLQNAAQAMTGQERAPTLALRLFAERETLVIEVEDNGPGVPEGLRQDVFLPFFTTRATGTGVGLNLARQIVVAHGGSIAISDAPGGGALFRILL
ncbi:sensor histidine kinase [Sphingomonas sp. R-74633]|uniref:sensor histidine kinase n=1 Tax=Sphingomonas sp. R-74633 TaxID=2751188 RepID=UPI0015D215FA|nr:ATP-binding protein [Sphingomonas sp. R-74633]NYT42046.1 sensor histidine kinase [Sphingomonas sp. R-74633]